MRLSAYAGSNPVPRIKEKMTIKYTRQRIKNMENRLFPLMDKYRLMVKNNDTSIMSPKEVRKMADLQNEIVDYSINNVKWENYEKFWQEVIMKIDPPNLNIGANAPYWHRESIRIRLFDFIQSRRGKT